MRISTNTIYDLGTTRISELQAALMRTQQQISANRRMLSPADDPIAAARALEVTQSQSLNTQYATNRQYASNSLSMEETALQSVTSLLQDVKTQVIEAGNAAYDDTQRKYIASDLRGRLEELLGLANTRDSEGNYLFSGFQTGAKAFSSSANGVQYSGDQGHRNLQVGAVRQMAISDSGDNVFERIPSTNTFLTAKASSFSHLAALPGNTGTTTASMLTAVTPALLTGHNYDVAVTDDGAGNLSYSAYDITVDPLKTTPVSTGVYADPQTITFDGMQMTLAGVPTTSGTDTFMVRPSTATASQLSVVDSSLLTGHNYDVVFTDDGLGNMSFAVYDLTLDPTKSNPLLTPLGSNAYTSPQTITFDGQRMTVTGAPAGTDTFSVRPSGTQSIFKSLDALIALLETPTGGALGNQNLAHGLGVANENFASALDNILTIRASVGSRLKELEKLDSAGEDRGLQYSATLSQLQDLDYVKAISELTMQKTTLEAAQQSYVKIIGLSLFDYI